MAGIAIVVPRAVAEGALRALQAADLLDPTRRIVSGAEVALPVREAPDLEGWARRLGGRLAPASLPARRPRRPPRDDVLARLEGRLPPVLLAEVPDRWERHGDVLVIRLPDALRPHEAAVARAFADAWGLKSVLLDEAGVAGELREMRARLLAGDDPVATHVENGVVYRFDASRIMFASGNVAERMRAATLPAAGETVVDMFAGIGYFALPLAVHARPARVVAIEKNPASHRWLVENARLNGVEGVVEPWLGDNRDYPHDGVADRVLMGYFPGTRAFLPRALRLLRPRGGTIHLHDTAPVESWRDDLVRAVLDASRACGAAVAIERARVVKSYAPGIVHAVVDARVRRAG